MVCEIQSQSVGKLRFILEVTCISMKHLKYSARQDVIKGQDE